MDNNQSANIQALLSVLNVFTGAPDKASLEKANSWLQDFQHSVNALSPFARSFQAGHLTSSIRPILARSMVDM
jgi:hypothetical protein